MADTAVYSEPDAKLSHIGAEPANQMHTNKRKRSSLEDTLSSRHGTAPGESNFLSSHSSSGLDPDSMEHTDFSALVQHNSGDQNLHQNGGSTTQGASDTAAAALSHYSMTVPQPTELSFQTHHSPGDNDRSFSMGDHTTGLPDFPGDQSQNPNTSRSPPSASGAMKPAVGSDEWHKVRRDNHKEVERRRRETINEGINELAKIVPGCEKNKGSILQRAVQFIQTLKDNENTNIEKWTLEKLVTEQALTELSQTVDKQRAETERAWKQVAFLKEKMKENGIEFDMKELEDGGEC